MRDRTEGLATVEWLTPPLLLIVLLAAVLSIIAGRMRREPIRSIALSAVGYPLSLGGLLWAGSLGTPAFVAAAAASLGAILFSMAASPSQPRTDAA